EQPLGESDATGYGLVEVDRRSVAVWRSNLADEPQIARVDHEEHGGDGLDRPARAEERNVEIVAPPARCRALGGEPVRRGLQLELGQVHRTPADVLVRPELQLLE